MRCVGYWQSQHEVSAREACVYSAVGIFVVCYLLAIVNVSAELLNEELDWWGM